MNQKPGRTPAAQARYWTKIILEAREYPGGIEAYRSGKKISKSNYYKWFKRLRAEHPEWKVPASHPSKVTNRNGSGSDPRGDMQPETEVVERPVRRSFTAAYKARILKEVDAAPAGGMAAILRREGLYSSHVQKWRAEESRRASETRNRGPKKNPLTAEVKRLRAENA